MSQNNFYGEIVKQLGELGWYTNDGSIWKKGDLQMSNINEVILWELQYWKAIQGNNNFVCPDCGYKVTFLEFENSLRD